MSKLKYIYRIGIELEGGWNTVLPGLKNDGSIRNISLPVKGEIASPPLTFKSCKAWIDKNCPVEVNNTCGLHIHVSLKDIRDYIRLMDNDFYEFFLLTMSKWGKDMKFSKKHEFWSRLAGKNFYCKKLWTPTTQANTKHSNDRYTHLNFAFAKHGTVECRLFPGFSDPKLIHEALCILISCYETWLDETSVTLTNEFEESFPLLEV